MSGINVISFFHRCSCYNIIEMAWKRQYLSKAIKTQPRLCLVSYKQPALIYKDSMPKPHSPDHILHLDNQQHTWIVE